VVKVEPPAPEQTAIPALPPAELPDAPAASTGAEQTAVIPPPPEPQPAPEPQAGPEAAPEPAPEPEPVAGTGNYLVQIASFRKIDDADAAWRRLIKKHGDLLSDFTARVERADLGAELGIYYRLRVGPMAGEAAAKSLCGKLKARNIDCLVVRP
jgi:cell division septation protein DedD